MVSYIYEAPESGSRIRRRITAFIWQILGLTMTRTMSNLLRASISNHFFGVPGRAEHLWKNPNCIINLFQINGDVGTRVYSTYQVLVCISFSCQHLRFTRLQTPCKTSNFSFSQLSYIISRLYVRSKSYFYLHHS